MIKKKKKIIILAAFNLFQQYGQVQIHFGKVKSRLLHVKRFYFVIKPQVVDVLADCRWAIFTMFSQGCVSGSSQTVPGTGTVP